MNIPLTIFEPSGIGRRDEMILGGIPLAKGQLDSGGWFWMTNDDEQRFPVEGSPAAWWPDGSIKWMHLCGAADLSPGENAFHVSPADYRPDSQLSVSQEDGGLHIHGGELDVSVRADATNLLRVSRQTEPDLPLLNAPGLSAELVLTDAPHGSSRHYEFCPTESDAKVVVDTANRVVVRIGSHFVDSTGTSKSELLIFIEVFRQSPQIHLQPVFIYGGIPEQELIRRLSLKVHLAALDHDMNYTFSNEQGRGFHDVVQRIEEGPRWPQARQIQLGSSFFRTDKRVGPSGSWVKAVEGLRAQGWCYLGDNQGGVTAATRRYWQEYPRGYSIDTDEGTLTYELWPEAAEPLDLRRYSPVIYGAPVYEYKPKSFEDGEIPITHGAQGIAKSHQLMLRFCKATDTDIAERGLAFSQPSTLIPDPVHLAGTQAIGHLEPESSRSAECEAQIHRMTDFAVQERDHRGWYGQTDFGDIMTAYYSELDRWAFDDGGYAWINTEHLPNLGLWISALRSGRSEWLEAAIDMSRHNRDIDTYHRGHFTGYGTRHNVNHWGCADKEWRISTPLVTRLHYYLTADPWTLETMLATIRVFQSYERTASVAPSMSSALAGLMVKWELTGDAQDGEVVRNMADVYANAVDADGMFTKNIHADLATGKGHPEGEEKQGSQFFMNLFGGQHTLVEIAELLQHDALSEAIERHVGRALEDDASPFSLLVFLGHVYRRTGDSKWLEAIERGVNGVGAGFEIEKAGGDGLLDEKAIPRLVGMSRTNKIACFIAGDILHQLPFGLAAMHQEHEPSSGPEAATSP